MQILSYPKKTWLYRSLTYAGVEDHGFAPGYDCGFFEIRVQKRFEFVARFTMKSNIMRKPSQPADAFSVFLCVFV